jgi:hypothetical protein
MTGATKVAGAPASPDRLGLIDWFSLVAFIAPIIAATIHSLAGVA